MIPTISIKIIEVVCQPPHPLDAEEIIALPPEFQESYAADLKAHEDRYASTGKDSNYFRAILTDETNQRRVACESPMFLRDDPEESDRQRALSQLLDLVSRQMTHYVLKNV